MVRFRQVQPDDIARIIRTLADWQPLDGCGSGLFPGDIGWALRFGREVASSRLVEWVSATGETLLIALLEDPGNSMVAIRPDCWLDRDLATAFVEWMDERAGASDCAIDGPNLPAVWRQIAAERGFESSQDIWAHLWLPLTGPARALDPGIESTEDPDNIADRVMVNRAAFERSTFTVERWHAMAGEAIFDRRFDLLVRASNGEPASAGTFWLAGPGTWAYLEPFGTKPDHRRQGHGRRLLAGAAALLQAEGASGISVLTPESNVAAVELYRSAGFRRIGLLSEMVRPATKA